jgi:SulP family sulfate permease
MMMAFCVLRLGRHVAKVPHSVVAGFSCGIGGMMIISQLRTIFALDEPAGGWKGAMLVQLAQVVQNLGHMRVEPFLVALTVVVVATAAMYWLPRGPAPLFGVVVALVVGKVFAWHEEEVGTLFAGLPSPVGFHWEPSDVWNVLPAAFGLAFVSSVDMLMTSRVVEHFRGRHRLVKKHDADMELGAYGIGNLIGGTFGAPTSVGIPARSLANVQCGASTAVSNIIHALFLVGLIAFGTHLLAQIPLAALAGVTAWMGARLLDWSTWRRLGKMRRVDAAAFAGTALAVLMINAVAAITIGCSFHLLHYAYRRCFATTAGNQ